MLGNSWKVRQVRRWLPPVVAAQMIATRLVGTPVGVLIVASIAYWWTGRFTSVTPMRGPELAAFLASQHQVVLTLLGVIVAYAAISTWKDEKRTELRIAAGADFSSFFQRCADLALPIGTAADDLLALKRAINAGQHLSELEILAQIALARRGRALQARAELSEATIAVHALKSRHTVLLSTSLVAVYSLSRATRRLSKLGDIMWFPMLEGAPTKAELIVAVAESNPAQWTRYERGSLPNSLVMQMWAGVIAGRLAGALFRPALGMAVVLWSQMRLIATIPVDPEDEGF